MKKEDLRRTLILLALLPLGALLSWVWMQPHYQAVPVTDAVQVILRPVDLLVQLGLVLVAALGIRTLLPSDQQHENGGETQ